MLEHTQQKAKFWCNNTHNTEMHCNARTHRTQGCVREIRTHATRVFLCVTNIFHICWPHNRRSRTLRSVWDELTAGLRHALCLTAQLEGCLLHGGATMIGGVCVSFVADFTVYDIMTKYC